MESTLKQSSSFGRVSSVDVSQLDKINAIPNKTTDNILMDGLCPEDRLYLNALMDNDSSTDEDTSRQGSAWSPMVQSPVLMDKRIKKMKPSYAITLSLEDISYIRPSWGISKGVRTIEIDKSKKKLPKMEVTKEKDKLGNNESNYQYFLVLLTVVILFLTVPTYVMNRKKEQDRISTNRLQVNAGSRLMEIYKLDGEEQLEPILKVLFAQGIPRDLRPDKCTCDIYTSETRRYDPDYQPFEVDDKLGCFSCLDWATRANMRVYVNRKPNNEKTCYNVKWQSYDTLLSPLIDCFAIEDGQWFGIGDKHSPVWPLNRLHFDWTPLVSNLSTEFSYQNESLSDISGQLSLGSYVEFSIFSNNGIHIDNIKTDFETSLKISNKQICLTVSCTEKCGQTWSRSDNLEQLKYQNNILEYTICSAKNLDTLISRQFEKRTGEIVKTAKSFDPTAYSHGLAIDPSKPEKLIDKEVVKSNESDSSANEAFKPRSLEPNLPEINPPRERKFPDGIGLIERTIFATSPEFMPALDGQTLRQYVDNIVKLGLKASSILLIDTRWETYAGSLKLNLAMFPKSKLLFEILHNKGFKIVFTIKPYIDTGIGVSNINQLFESGRIYAVNYRGDTRVWKFSGARQAGMSNVEETQIIRRKSLFTFQNQSIGIGPKDLVKFPLITRCKESQEGYCVLIDLTQPQNRAWMVGNIMRSSLLTLEADGIQIGGTHPNSFHWSDQYRDGISELSKTLLFKERLYTLPQWTGDFGYIQLASRSLDWDSLRSVVNSVLDMGTLGFSLIHPGSVWGDLKSANMSQGRTNFKATNRMDSIYGESESSDNSEAELVTRWLQVSVFLPILQFNNIAPIERHGLQELVQNLIRIRKIHIVPELKKYLPFTPLVGQSKPNPNNSTLQLPLIRPVWFNQENNDSVVPQQFGIGSDILVAPILSEGLRQRDIYLPIGFWRDELRQLNLRGGKWLRNYPIELNEIAWFTRVRR